MPGFVADGLVEDSAVILAGESFALYKYLIDKRLGWPNMVKSDQSALSLAITFKVTMQLTITATHL